MHAKLSHVYQVTFNSTSNKSKLFTIGKVEIILNMPSSWKYFFFLCALGSVLMIMLNWAFSLPKKPFNVSLLLFASLLLLLICRHFPSSSYWTNFNPYNAACVHLKGKISERGDGNYLEASEWCMMEGSSTVF